MAQIRTAVVAPDAIWLGENADTLQICYILTQRSVQIHGTIQNVLTKLKPKRGTIILSATKKTYRDIPIGARFYHNNYSTKRGHCLPDYLRVIAVRGNFVVAKYENHYVYTKERTFAFENLWTDSNLNGEAQDPSWIFLPAS